MKKIVCILALVLFAFGRGIAEDITLSDGTIYKNATATKQDAVNATILFSDGGATVPMSKLPAAIQARLGYSAAAAESALQAQEVYDAKIKLLRLRAQILSSASLSVSGKIIQVLPNGFIGELSYTTCQEVVVPVTTTSAINRNPINGQADVVSVSTSYKTTTVRSGTDLGKVFVSCDSSGCVDDQGWSGIVWKIGTFSYTTVMGAPATVFKYTASPDEAFQALASK